MRTSVLYFLLLFCLLSASCRRQAVNKGQKAKVEFLSETYFDFGVDSTHDTLEHYFVYRNVGNVPFIINKVETSCGCTTTRYSKRPLPPGGIDSIRLALGLKDLINGYLYKGCSVYSNADTTYQLVLQVKLMHQTPHY